MPKRIAIILSLFAAMMVVVIWHNHRGTEPHFTVVSAPHVQQPDHLTPFQHAVLADLDRQVKANIRYQDGYFMGGDPPPGIGVCTDVVIRSYRAAGVDLHRLVAGDIARHRSAYGIDRPDPNIDHRRCRNLEVFFSRNATRLPISGPNADWQAGDIVIWSITGTGVADHIGVITNRLDDSGVPTVVHHVPGQFVVEMDSLYGIPIVSHFRWNSE